MPTAAGRVGRCPARPAQQPAGRSRAVSWAQRGWPCGAWLPACERDTPRTGVAPSAAAAHLSLGGDRGACGAVPLRFRLTSPGPAPAVACRLPRVTRESRKVPARGRDQVRGSCCKFHELVAHRCSAAASCQPGGGWLSPGPAGQAPGVLDELELEASVTDLAQGGAVGRGRQITFGALEKPLSGAAEDVPLPRHGPSVFQGWGTELWDLSCCMQERKQA